MQFTEAPAAADAARARPAPAGGGRRGADRSRFDLAHPSGLLGPRPADLAGRLAAGRLEGRHPVVGAVAVAVAGYAGLLVLLTAIGLLITGPFEGSIGVADLDANRWLADHRTPFWDTFTRFGSGLANTPVVILVGSVVASILLVRRWAQGTVALAVALFTEVAVFLTTVLLVPRDRPDVPKLDQVPPTSSFPSGHTAASIALYGMLGIIAAALLHRAWAARLALGVAVLVPVAVGFSRLYRGMHHPSDVLAGVLLGLGALLVAVVATRVALLLARQRDDARPQDGAAPARRRG